MAVERTNLESLKREQLVQRARAIGIERPEVLTRLELLDEILSASIADDKERKAARGLLGRARDLVARVVEKGLNLPDAAQRLRTLAPPMAAWRRAPPPIATVSLAEIYARQGHEKLARKVLDEVLEHEPEHQYARMLRDRLEQAPALADVPAPSPSPPSPEDAVELEPAVPPAPKPTAARIAEPPEPARAPVAPSRPTQRVAAFPLDDAVQLEVLRGRARLTWQLRPRSFAHALATYPDGRLVVRLLRVHASWEGPRVDTDDVPVDALRGGMDRVLPDSASALCAAIGWLSPAGFSPLASARKQ
jgi:hypothetical protein